jgi:hypothetical protein
MLGVFTYLCFGKQPYIARVPAFLGFYITFSPSNFLASSFFQCLCVENSRIIAGVRNGSVKNA